MNAAQPGGRTGIRYQPDEQPPVTLTVGLGLQLAGLNIAAVMLMPTVIVRAAGETEAYLSWAVLMSVAICGMTTMLQALRYGRIGAGHIVVMCTSAAFIPVCIMALSTGGPAMLATLVVIAAFVPLALSWKLSLFQRILTPTVSGTVIMLIPIATLPVVSQLLGSGAEDGAAQGPALSFFATALIICAIALKAPARWRVWAAVIGIVAGSIFAAMFGLYDAQRVAGGFIAILMTLLLELAEAQRSRLVTLFSPYALSAIRSFLGRFATRNNWDSAMTDRLGAVVEETMLSLLQQEEADEKRSRRRMQLVAYREDGDAVLELVIAPMEENLQDQLALLNEQTDEISIEREVSLRLLRHLASSVRHQQFYDTDIVTVRVKPPVPSGSE